MKLTPREKQIADLVARGLPNKLIAYELGVAYGNVKFRMVTIFQKTGCKNRTELALHIFAQQHGLSN